MFKTIAYSLSIIPILSVTRIPGISDCSVTMYANDPESVVARANCAPPGQSAVRQWANSPNPTRLQVSWKLNYLNPVSVPDREYAAYVFNSPVVFGVTEARAFTNLSAKCKYCKLKFLDVF